MRKTFTVALITFCCAMQGCALFSRTKRNYPIGDKPTIVETTHKITQSNDNQISPDSSRVDFITYDDLGREPEPYTRVEILGMQPTLTARDGHCSIVAPKGTYTIKIGSEEAYTIKCVELRGGTVTQIYVAIGGSVWR